MISKSPIRACLPDLFREGQGVVAEGVLEAPGQMRAETILAKHDERYMPREVVDALKKQGRWQEGNDGGHTMIVEIGHFALVLALAAALIQTIVPFWGARVGDVGLMRVGRNAALIQLALIAIAFAALVNAHLTSDFSVLNVAENSNVAMPAIYKISGVWGNHEGSMLLWVLILAIFGALVALFGRALPAKLRADALAVQGLISLAFLAFILLTSNPFERLAPAPFEGRDLNPILQDPGLAIHPPLLYLGYVGFSIVYSFAAAALIEGRIDAAWARFVRPFTLVAWSFLTLVIPGVGAALSACSPSSVPNDSVAVRRRHRAGPGAKQEGASAHSQLRQPARFRAARRASITRRRRRPVRRRRARRRRVFQRYDPAAAAARRRRHACSSTGTRRRCRSASATTPSSRRGRSRETFPARSCTAASATRWSSR